MLNVSRMTSNGKMNNVRIRVKSTSFLILRSISFGILVNAARDALSTPQYPALVNSHSHKSTAEQTLDFHPVYLAREINASMQFQPGTPVNFYFLLPPSCGARVSAYAIVSA